MAMKHFAYVLYVGFDAQRNLCDKQNILFHGTPILMTDTSAHYSCVFIIIFGRNNWELFSEKKFASIKVIKEIVDAVKQSSHLLLNHLLAQLRTNIQLPTCLRIIGNG